MKWPTFEMNLRLLINDDSSKQKYTTERLLEIANDVRGILAEDLLLQSQEEFEVVDDVFAIPDDFSRVVRVEYIVDNKVYILKNFWDANLLSFDISTGQPTYYFLRRPDNDSFQINGVTNGHSVRFVYSRFPAEFTNDDDEADIVLEDEWHYRALAYLVANYVFSGESSNRAQLMQWGQRPDLNVGNPLMEISDWMFDKYNQLISRYATWRRS